MVDDLNDEVKVTRIIDSGIYTYLSSTFKAFSPSLLVPLSQYQSPIFPHQCFPIPSALFLEFPIFLCKRLQLFL